MKNLFKKVSPSMILSQFSAAAVAYYLLLSNNSLHCSIADIVNYSHTLPLGKHLLLVALLPIYIGFVIFGTSLAFASINNKLRRLLSPNQQRKKVQNMTLDAKFEPEA